uniref:Chromo domain-containing protein n=1 Tax=Parastrongyloides trichosuri TaxID=131310 RepID=A0A0N4ZN93_PARTI
MAGKKKDMRKGNITSNTDEETFIVENIVGKKRAKDGTTLYKIKWLNYSAGDSTWEPESNIDESLVRRYERCLLSKKKFNASYDSDSEDEKNMGKIVEILDRKMKTGFPVYKVRYENVSKPQWVTEQLVKDKSLISAFENKKSVTPVKTPRKSVSGRKGGSSSKKRSSSEADHLITSSHEEKKRKRSPAVIKSPTVEEDVKEYVVERIMEHKMIDGKMMYKVRWEGYGPADDSWLLASDFTDIDYIKEYEEECKKDIRKVHAEKESSDNNFLKNLIRNARKGVMYKKEDIYAIISKINDENMDACYLVQLQNRDLVCIYPGDIPKELYKHSLQLSQYKISI